MVHQRRYARESRELVGGEREPSRAIIDDHLVVILHQDLIDVFRMVRISIGTLRVFEDPIFDSFISECALPMDMIVVDAVGRGMVVQALPVDLLASVVQGAWGEDLFLQGPAAVGEGAVLEQVSEVFACGISSHDIDDVFWAAVAGHLEFDGWPAVEVIGGEGVQYAVRGFVCSGCCKC